MRRCYAAIRGVHTCEDATIRCRSKDLETLGSARDHSERLAIRSRLERYGHYHHQIRRQRLSALRRKGVRRMSLKGTQRIGVLQIGESVTVKTKSRFWKAVVVDLEPSAAANSASQSSRKRQAVRVKIATS